MRLVKVGGSPYEIGLQYGEQCQKEIRRLIPLLYLITSRTQMPDFQAGKLKLSYSILSLLTYRWGRNKIRRRVKDFEAYLSKFCPELKREMEGIALGAKVKYEEVLFLNAWCDLTFGFPGCSGWMACGGATRSGDTLIGMNFDYIKLVAGHLVILEVKPSQGYKFIGVTLAGSLGPISGMNEKGLAGGGSALYLRSREQASVPSLALSNMIYTHCSNVTEFLEMYQRFPRPLLGLAEIFVDKRRGVRLESSATAYSIEEIEDGFAITANHSTSEALKDFDLITQMSPFLQTNTFLRYKRLSELLSERYGELDEKFMMELARDHGITGKTGICQHLGSTFLRVPLLGIQSLFSLIAKPSELKLWIAPGPPCRHQFREFSL